MTDDLSDQEIERYARHLILDEIGEDGQAKLQAARVAIIGLGGIGSPVAQYLASAGVGGLRLIDPDVVDLSNLQRQVIHGMTGLGDAKVTSAAKAIARLNPLVDVEPCATAFSPSHLQGCDLVVDGTDSYQSRRLIGDSAWNMGVPLVSGAAIAWDGQLLLQDPSVDGAPSYRDWFPTPPQTKRSCAEAGIFAPLVGAVGCMAAGLALRRLIGLETDAHRLLLIDGRDFSSRAVRWRARG